MANMRGNAGLPSSTIAAVRGFAAGIDTRTGAGLDALVQAAGAARVVLIGEASHGTSEFYRLRQCITQRLIAEHGFNIVAAEGDWPDAARVDDQTRGRTARALPVEGAFERFPRWVWRNEEFLDFAAWLRRHNADMPGDQVCSFHGLDLYSMNRSIDAVIGFLENRDPALGQLARERYGCILPFAEEPQDYGHAVLLRQHRDCEGEVSAMLADLLRRQINMSLGERPEFFDAQQNARIIRNAERYYRAVHRGSAESWNVRGHHMFETLLEVMSVRGRDSKAVVWAHNTHVGDASATQMGSSGEINLGQLTREHLGEQSFHIGFGTHTGTVAAADDWGDMVDTMAVRPSIEGSYERLMHETGMPAFYLTLRDADPRLREALAEERLQRAIGAVYRPHTERMSHYFTAHLLRQFDAYVWIDETSAVSPIDDGQGSSEDSLAHRYAREGA